MIIAAICTIVWFCIDDHVAQIFNNEMLGTAPWWVVFLAFWLVAFLLARGDKD